jgi:hypothetical protein
VAASGVSDKSPKGKGLAMARAIEEEETAASFPAGIIYECIFKGMFLYSPTYALIMHSLRELPRTAALRGCASFVIDAPAASKLSFDYAECFSLRGNRGDCCPPEDFK